MKNVLLIEDDQTMKSLLKTLLEMEGYSVMIMGDKSGDEIVRSVGELNPHMIILDVHLRLADGIQVLSELRKEEAYRSIKIIISSGTDYRDKCLQLGADGYLLKPYMPDELLDMLKS